MILKDFYLLIVCMFIGSILAQIAWADTSSNSQYKLDTNILNSYKDTQSNTDAIQENTQTTKPNLQTGENYKLIYPLDNSLFVFSISPTLIDYGILSPTNSVKRTNTIQLLSQHVSGYTVTVAQNHKLATSFKTEVPDTSCDTGMCSIQTADLWNNSLTYGFGYRCDNLYNVPSCPNDFSSLNYYKRFPNISESGYPYRVIEQIKAINSQALITYQVNTSRTQRPGSYNNGITFIATPNF